MEQFYNVFRSIYLYIFEYERLIKGLNSNQFINTTIDIAVSDPMNCALLAEGLFQYGIMMLILDIKIPGPVREGIIVSYFRYRGKSAIPNMNDVIKICGSTNISKNSNAKNPEYPVDLFARYQVNQTIVSHVINRIKDNDIYQQMKAYPSGSHRTVALANQGSLLYILLFFYPVILRDRNEDMRDIVNKHFCDNWFISYFQGYTADLFESWKKFRAAIQALERIITIEKVKEQIGRAHV